jgi:polyferredoxin
MGYDKGLIRHATEHELEGKKVHFVRAKLIGYAIVLFVMTSLLVLEMVNRVPVSMEIIRDRNELAKENFNGDIENVYTLKILNKSQKDNRYRLSVKGINNTKWNGDQEVLVKAAKVYTLPISLSVAPEELEDYMTDISFVIELVSETDEVKLEHESRFFNKR